MRSGAGREQGDDHMSRTLRVTSTLAALAAVVALGSPSFAAKSPKGRGGGTTTQTASSIEIDTVTNADGTSVKATAGSVQPNLGSQLTSNTTVQALAGWQYPMVVIACYQDVNNDGTIDKSTTGPDLVYLQLDHPDATFVLGGGWSKWLDRGGSAVCEADLYAYPGLHKG